MYELLFRAGTTFWYRSEIIEEREGTAAAMRCTVDEVRQYVRARGARLHCDGREREDEPDEPTRELPFPREVTPDGFYVATASGLFRLDRFPDNRELASMGAEQLLMTPEGGARAIRTDERGQRHIERGGMRDEQWCGVSSTPGWPEAGRGMRLCFRPGAGLVSGGYEWRRGEELLHGAYRLVASELAPRERARASVARANRALVINEVSAAGADWIEVVNASGRQLQLDDFVYTDRPDDFSRVVAFPTALLEPGGYWKQPVNHEASGFALNGSESLAVYRTRDRQLSDQVSWQENDAPAGGSFARIPDTTGSFQTVTPATPGARNQ